MSILTLPQARIPLGWATVQGQRVPVEIDMEWMLYLTTLTERAGGTVAPTNLYQSITYLPQSSVVLAGDEEGEPGPMGPPGMAGAMGTAGQSIPGADGEDGEPGVFMFAPQGYRDAVNQTASRALNTTYTNLSTQSLLIQATVRCAVTLAGGNAQIQGASPAGTIATGVIGIQAGLLGEDNSFQIVFVAAPGATYRLNSATVNGTATLGAWFEFPL